MNDTLVAAFVKAAVNFGADDDTIARLFKRAMEDSSLDNMFRENVNLNNQQSPNQQAQPEAEQLKQYIRQNPQLLPALKQYVG
jgi:hypothetical protein